MLNWFRRKKTLKIDTDNIKRIVGVSDWYWDELYQPIFNVINITSHLFGLKQQALLDDFSRQFIASMRRNKGGVLDEPLLSHISTFGLALSFSAVYLARLCVRFEFYSINIETQERKKFYPWVEVPPAKIFELRIKKVSNPKSIKGIAPAILGELLSSLSKQWLHDNQQIYDQVLICCCTGGEGGVYSDLLCYITDPFREVSFVPDDLPESTGTPIGATNNNAEIVDQLIDDNLINELGGAPHDISIEELMQARVKSGVVEETTPMATGGIVGEDITVESHEDITNELMNKLGLAQSKVSSKFPNLADDFVTWAIDLINNSRSGLPGSGLYAVNFDGKLLVGCSKKAFLSFSHSDYSLDSEADYKAVADEVENDFLSSDFSEQNTWSGVPTPMWRFQIGTEEVEMYILRNSDLSNLSIPETPGLTLLL